MELSPANPEGFNEDRERKVAWRMVGLLLLSLTVAKSIAWVPFLGTLAITVAAVMQLYIPLWRVQTLGLDRDFVGLHLRSIRQDLKGVGLLVLVTFPPYALAHFWFMTEAHAWLSSRGIEQILRYVPQMRFAPGLPPSDEWLARFGGLLQSSVTHFLGVALPEETFYRGYLQPRLESGDPPKHRICGVPFGRATIWCTFMFALGHVLGEWNPLRLGPFLPGLVFAWQRNATQSVVGAIVFHALCNILGEVLFSLYTPM